MINYAEIKEKYPSAYGALLIWIPNSRWNMSVDEFVELADDGSLYIVSSPLSCSEFADRDLFDFFDEQGLDISILSHFASSEGFIKGQRTYTFQLLNFELRKFAGSYNTRPEAETAAFAKAFEILENQLSQ